MYSAARHTPLLAALAPGTDTGKNRMDIGNDLVAASATPLILTVLAGSDAYGYAILKRAGELSGGRMGWTDAMLYPVLHRLERLGHVEARWEAADSGRRRKYYRITARGRALRCSARPTPRG